MVFSGIPFLYLFLPVALLLYYITPRRLKNLCLLILSLFFYFYGEQLLVLVMLLSAFVNYFCALLIEKAAKKENGKRGFSRAVLVASIVFNLALLGYFKYTDFFISNINALFGASVGLLRIALPIGISFYTFQTMSYVIDVYRGSVEANHNIVDFATYVTFFPQLIAGPVVRYSNVADGLKDRTHSFEMFSAGAWRFVIGLSKKVLLANNLALLVDTILYSGEKTVLFSWMGAVTFTMQIYFDFSGYSDMAVGLGKMFGFKFPENFDYPYISASVTEFWRRWHITLGTWFRDYVYIPLGGNRVKKYRWILNMLIVWLLTGFWHGAEWNFVLWGAFYGVILIAEKLLRSAVPKLKIPRVVGVFYTFFMTVIGFAIFSADKMDGVKETLSAMFGLSNLPFLGTETLYNLKSYAVVIIIAAIAATPIAKLLWERLSKYKTAASVLNYAEPVALCVLLLLCTGYLIDGSFNPFLYFRF